MANTTKKYVSLSKLTKYDELLKAKMAADDAATLKSAKDYVDESFGLANENAASVAATAKSEAIAAAKTETEAQVKALADGQVKTNKEAIEAIRDDANIDSFADVVAELAKKQGVGDYATKAEAKGYADAKDEAIAAAKAAGDAAQEDATKNAEDIAAINNAETGILAQAKKFASEEDAKVQANIDTLSDKVGAVPENQTVMDIIENIQENAYDDTEIQEKIDAVSGKVNILVGEDANKSVRTIANEELAKQLIAEGADASLDTLQEIAKWIQDHPADAAAMNEAIVALQNKVDTGDKTVSTYVTDAIDALKIGDYAKAADLTALAGRVSALETASATHALKTEVEAVSTSLTEYKDAHKDDYTNAQIDAAIKVVADDVAALGDTYATDTELAQAIEGEISRANGAYAAKALETTVSEHKADTVVHITAAERTAWNASEQNAKDYADGLNSAMTTKVDGAISRIGANETAIGTINTELAKKAAQTDLDDAVARIAANETAIASFVEVSESEINALFGITE